MKPTSLLLALCLTLWFSSCKKETEPAPVIDQRDQHIGMYVCKVIVQNYTTKKILSTYLDTLELSKVGQNQIQIKDTKQPQLPDLEVLSPQAYYGLFTVLSFERDTLSITNGPDSLHYVYKGFKLK